MKVEDTPKPTAIHFESWDDVERYVAALHAYQIVQVIERKGRYRIKHMKWIEESLDGTMCPNLKSGMATVKNGLDTLLFYIMKLANGGCIIIDDFDLEDD